MRTERDEERGKGREARAESVIPELLGTNRTSLLDEPLAFLANRFSLNPPQEIPQLAASTLAHTGPERLLYSH